MKKQRTYYLTLSQTFPATHPRKGEPTYFKEKTHNALLWEKGENVGYALTPSFAVPDGKQLKLHTLRGNYDRWNKIFEQIYAGEACLSLRVWSGKPYRSKMIEIARLTKDDGIGIQKLEFKKAWGIMFPRYVTERPIVRNMIVPTIRLAENDGLSYDDWLAWFESYDLSKPLAIIHFTNFRY